MVWPSKNWPKVCFFFNFGTVFGWPHWPTARIYFTSNTLQTSTYTHSSKLVYPPLFDNYLSRNNVNLTLENRINSDWSYWPSQTPSAIQFLITGRWSSCPESPELAKKLAFLSILDTFWPAQLACGHLVSLFPL